MKSLMTFSKPAKSSASLPNLRRGPLVIAANICGGNRMFSGKDDDMGTVQADRHLQESGTNLSFVAASVITWSVHGWSPKDDGD